MLLLAVWWNLAQAAEPVRLDLQETLKLVVENNPDHRSAELAEEVAAIGARRARLDRFSASLSAGAAGNTGVVKPWGEDLVSATDANWDARAAVGVPLYSGGAIRAEIDRADAGAQIAELDRELTERSLVRAAYSAYWNIKGYELQIAAAQEGLDLTQQALDIIVAKANAGLAAGIDVNRSKVDLYSQQESLVSQKAELYKAEQELLRLLNLPGDHVVLTEGPPPVNTTAVTLPEMRVPTGRNWRGRNRKPLRPTRRCGRLGRACCPRWACLQRPVWGPPPRGRWTEQRRSTRQIWRRPSMQAWA